MANQASESTLAVLKFALERRVMLQFCGSVITSDAALFHTANWTTFSVFTEIKYNSDRKISRWHVSVTAAAMRFSID